MKKLELIVEKVEMLQRLAIMYSHTEDIVRKAEIENFADSLDDSIYDILGHNNIDELLKEYLEDKK